MRPRSFWNFSLASGIAALVLVLAGMLPVAAHPANEANIYHYLYLRVTKGEVSLQHATVVGGLVTARVWPTLDTDGDRSLSEAEQLRAARELAAGLTVRLNGKPLPLRLDSYEFPTHTEFFGGAFPATKLLLTATLPASTKGRLEVQDETYPHHQGVLPTPELRPDEVKAAVNSISKDGRTVLVELGSEATSAQSSGMPPLPELSSSGSVAPKDAAADRLPGLRLAPEGEDLLGPRPGGGDAAPGKQTAKPVPDTTPSLDMPTPDPKRIFPRDPKIVWAAPKDAVHSGEHPEHEEALGLRGLLGRRLGLLEILLGLLAALIAGAAHALEPGHGKSMVAAYLVGTRGTVKDAILLGVVVTLSHTAGVYVLGFLTLQLTHFIRAEVIGQWLSLTSALLVLGMGFWLFQRGLLHYHGIRPMVDHGHSHSGGGHSHAPAPLHSHAHAHAGGGHTHAAHDAKHLHDAPAASDVHPSESSRRPPHDSPVEEYSRAASTEGSAPGVGKWGILGLGLAGGIVPCYAALALLVAAINLGNVALGLALIAVFSVGMALVLVAVGIVMVKARHWVGALNQESRWMQALPAVSGGVMLCLGIWLTFQALVTAGVLRVGS